MYLAVIFGAFLFLDYKFNKGYARTDFMWSKFLLKNLGQTILNILSGFLIVWLWKNDPEAWIFKTILGAVDLSRCVFFGVTGQLIFTAALQAFDKDTKTKLGINKKN